MRFLIAAFSVLLFASFCPAQSTTAPAQSLSITSRDGTRIALECMGQGPSLLIVHGGTGDRRRWQPLLPLFAARFNVCAMDRRGHGQSERGPNYRLEREFEDVAAAANSRPGPVFVLGHSIGGVFALEASFLTGKIAKLALYEPPLQDGDHTAIADRMEEMIQAGKREEALLTFLREIVQLSPAEIAAMKARPIWPERVAGIDIQLREVRALSHYQFDAQRIRKARIPTLLLTGSKTRSPQLKQAIDSLMRVLPKRQLVVLEGEEHNAMDTMPQRFADVVTKFLLKR